MLAITTAPIGIQAPTGSTAVSYHLYQEEGLLIKSDYIPRKRPPLSHCYTKRKARIKVSYSVSTRTAQK